MVRMETRSSGRRTAARAAVRRFLFLCSPLLLLTPTARADDLTIQGYLDFRAVLADDTRTWTDGGLGKTRWGGDGGVHFGGAALALGWQATPTLLAFAELQAQADGDPDVDLMIAYLRWRPENTYLFAADGTRLDHLETGSRTEGAA